MILSMILCYKMFFFFFPGPILCAYGDRDRERKPRQNNAARLGQQHKPWYARSRLRLMTWLAVLFLSSCVFQRLWSSENCTQPYPKAATPWTFVSITVQHDKNDGMRREHIYDFYECCYMYEWFLNFCGLFKFSMKYHDYVYRKLCYIFTMIFYWLQWWWSAWCNNHNTFSARKITYYKIQSPHSFGLK